MGMDGLTLIIMRPITIAPVFDYCNFGQSGFDRKPCPLNLLAAGLQLSKWYLIIEFLSI